MNDDGGILKSASEAVFTVSMYDVEKRIIRHGNHDVEGSNKMAF